MSRVADEAAAHGDSVTAHADVFEVDGTSVARLVSRSSIRSAAPSGICRFAAECASALTDSIARSAEPRRWPQTCSISANTSLVSRAWREDLGADVGGEVGQVQAKRQVAEVAQPLDVDDGLARLELQPAGDGGRRG